MSHINHYIIYAIAAAHAIPLVSQFADALILLVEHGLRIDGLRIGVSPIGAYGNVLICGAITHGMQPIGQSKGR